MGLAPRWAWASPCPSRERKVVVLDGDGSVLMNLGGLTTLACYAPGNSPTSCSSNDLLSGRVPTATATGLAGIAHAAGIANAGTVTDLEAFRTAGAGAIAGDEPACLVAKVEPVCPRASTWTCTCSRTASSSSAPFDPKESLS